MKLKTYPLIFSRRFPAKHPRVGQDTLFIPNIRGGSMLHTIRGNYAYWQPKIAAVQRGEAVLSLRYWTGRPYNSPPEEFARLTAADDVGIERLVDYADHGQVSAHDDPRYRAMVDLDQLAENHGLSQEDFTAWFPSWGFQDERALIHLTGLRYCEAPATNQFIHGITPPNPRLAHRAPRRLPE